MSLLDSLEQRGLVERSRSERDRRNYELALTETGRGLLGPLRTIAEAHQRAVLAALTPEEQAQLAELLGKLAAGGELPPDAHPGYASLPPSPDRATAP